MRRPTELDVAFEYIRDVTNLDYKRAISRCMNCGKPFNYTIAEDKHTKSRIVKRDVPVPWNLYRGFYMCDQCKEDKIKNPEKEFTYFNKKIRIEDVQPKNYIRLMSKYIKPCKE